MKTNTHGLKMSGLTKASEATTGLGRNQYVQISYDTSDGTILTDYHCSIGEQSWSEYHSGDIITVRTTSRRHTRQQIADAVADAMWVYEQAERAANQ